MISDADTADLLQAMGHPLRIVILRALGTGPLTVGQIQARSGESQALVSRHLATLRGAGLVRADRGDTDARSIFYTISDPRVEIVLSALPPGTEFDAGPRD